jgi:hypothetical protein
MKHLPFFLILVLIGCSRRPAEMPATFPCKIVIVNDGSPQVDYDVHLHLTTGNGALSIRGCTNAAGIAEIKTRFTDYTANGSPVGTFKVTIDKQPELPPDGVDITTLPWGEELNTYLTQRMKELEKLRIVPIHLTKPDSTPFEIKLEKGGKNQWTFDLKEHIP